MDGAFPEVPELVPARMLNEFVYCPRLAHLEWVQQEFADSADTIRGRYEHRRVDEERGELPEAEDLGEEARIIRSALLSAPEEGLIAKMDLLETSDGKVRPVDYKHGRPPSGGGIWPADRVQIGAQVLILRENGYQVEEAVLYYLKTKRKTVVPVEEAFLEQTRTAVRDLRHLLATGVVPPPLEDSPKCVGCSLAGICLPDETQALHGVTCAEDSEVRMLYPARDDALPVYVQAQGGKVGKSADTLRIRIPDGGETKVRFLDVSQLCLMGNVQVSSQCLTALAGAGIPVLWFSRGGWFYAIAHGLGSRNAFVRIEQYRVVTSRADSLALARGFVSRKIQNCRTILRRNLDPAPQEILGRLERLATQAREMESMKSLLGVEGTAARLYFSQFQGLLKPESREGMPSFHFEDRNRRPPKDPVNALLSLAYSCLAKDWTVALLAVGLDPYLGFYHQPRYGRPALALDMMEEFRPLVADSVVFGMINNGEVGPGDFIRRGAGVALKEKARKQFFSAYERRMQICARVPLFGYRVSYRRLLEVQARLLIRFLTGEIPEYPGFTTR